MFLWIIVNYSTIQRISNAIQETRENWLSQILEKINLAEKMEAILPDPAKKERLLQLSQECQTQGQNKDPLELDKKVNVVLQQFLDAAEPPKGEAWLPLQDQLMDLRQKTLSSKRKLQVLEEDYQLRATSFPNRLLVRLFKV
ncbi:MAG: hypothetical protein AAFU64_06260 [Bacteroidota bacterium]